MSYFFNAASTQYIRNTATPVDNTPFTMACWFRVTSAGTNRTLMSIENSTATDGWRLICSGTNVIRFAGRSNNTITFQLDTTATWTANTWHHACATSASNSNRSIYLDGGNVITSSTTVTAPAAARTNITIGAAANTGQPFTGQIAEVAIWNEVLTASEIASLGKSMSPSLIRPQSLRVYIPLIRELNELSSRLSLQAISGPTVDTHPRIYGT